MSNVIYTPAITSDPSFKVLADLVESSFSNIDLTVLLIYIVDAVPEEFLPYLSDQFHVRGLEGWDFAKTVDDKRALIKQSIELHRYKGTPWAVEQVLTLLRFDGLVSEWFEYGGSPYRFKVDVDLSKRGITQFEYERLFELIIKYKNKRSRLDGVTFTVGTHSKTPAIASLYLSAETTIIYPFVHITTDLICHIPVSTAGILSSESITIYPKKIKNFINTSLAFLSAEQVVLYPAGVIL